MGFLSKIELKKQLKKMGIKIEGNYVRKKEVEKVLSARKNIPLTPDHLLDELTGICSTLHEMKSDIKQFGFTKLYHLDAAYTSLSFFQDEFEDYITEIAENEEENE